LLNRCRWGFRIIDDALLPLLLCICIIGSETACSGLIKKSTQPLERKSLPQEKALLAKIFEKNFERSKNFKDLKAFAEITLKFPQKKLKRKNVIFLRNDPSIRFETLSILGRPFIYFTANKETAAIYYPDRNILYKGTSSSQNFAKKFGISISLEKILIILSGNFIVPSETQKIELNENNEGYLLKFLLKNRTKEVLLDKGNFLPQKVIEYDKNKKNIITVRFNNYTKISDYFLPFSINIEIPQKSLKIFFHYKSAELNQGIADSFFSLPINKGVKVLPIEAN